MNINKNIKFYALTINSDIFDILNYLYIKGNEFATLNISELNCIENILQLHKGISNCSLDNRLIMLENINYYIKQKIQDNYKFQFDRRINNYKIFYGSTVTDITYCISINKMNKVKISLFFAPCKRNTFDYVLRYYKQIIKETKMDITFTSKMSTIVCNIDYEISSSLEDCRHVAEIFSRFYYCMQKYIF